jgi:hypothetical protein
MGSAAHSLSGSVPAVTGRQRPSATPVLTFAQALQRVAQADSQQTPSTQSPLAHWLAAEHDAPLVWGAMQCPVDEQKVLLEQSAFERHEVLQEVVPQT